MFADCCQNEWMCPTTSFQSEFTDESRAKPFTPIDKHSISTGVYDASTTSPDSNGSKQSYVLERLSTAQTIGSPVHHSRKQELSQLDALIMSRQRSCSVLNFECKKREAALGKAFMASTLKLRTLNNKYQQQMKELDRMEKVILTWEKNRHKQPVGRFMRSPTRL